ncbi:type II toxin-antitoxin system RelE/ParE family toxin [Marinomonas sp. BSi20584]|uniref:type II toxin-antitoxin system RelE/ParE family toxin n=1 Tax=Marinomonas sp. BSi20584 TaxID=1594462 RepID=UPI000C1E4B8B|nr:type II toxin-antitoxin system RelE/ParE family toxin [Marinomonas sp. BSi20584]PJE55963.1 plasmid stabilization protein [Marinomonas sp. BSi20584]
MKVSWSPLAMEKLGHTADFITLDNSNAAEKWVNDLFDKTELLTGQPEMGRLVPELQKANLRKLIFGNYRIIYMISTEIRILTVRNCRQMLTEKDL